MPGGDFGDDAGDGLIGLTKEVAFDFIRNRSLRRGMEGASDMRGAASSGDVDISATEQKYCIHTFKESEEAATVVDVLEKAGCDVGHIAGSEYIAFEKRDFNKVVRGLEHSGFGDVADKLKAGNYLEVLANNTNGALYQAEELLDKRRNERSGSVCRYDFSSPDEAQKAADVLEENGIEIGHEQNGNTILFYFEDTERIVKAMGQANPDFADAVKNERVSRFKSKDLDEASRKVKDFDARQREKGAKKSEKTADEKLDRKPENPIKTQSDRAKEANDKEIFTYQQSKVRLERNAYSTNEFFQKGTVNENVKVPKDLKTHDREVVEKFESTHNVSGMPLPKVPADKRTVAQSKKTPSLDSRLNRAVVASKNQSGHRPPQIGKTKRLDKVLVRPVGR
jgi:hypothetical protein